ncbi:MAG: recombination regulator RecX [Proteobacteria bacterium]|nr:recombination regulator RecX [Pseudomonadota bacterium]MCH9712246.1 recombination regulator RecX [Pseudomonadota bacterium]MCH9749295.1 recombination regulator RecX [Pseudomonadota bacterium]
MRMLVRREHSTLELTTKLSAKEFDQDDIDAIIASLIQQNYQSDERFAAEFIQMRFNQGKGPIKISLDLKQRGIDQFDLSEYDFYALACKIREQKFGQSVPSDFKEKAKQQRFLQSRGFSFEHISQSFKTA